MDEVLNWLNPSKLLDWASANPWIMAAGGVLLLALVGWQIWRGSVGTRRFVVNLVGIGLVVWGTLWVTDWVRPSLTPEQLFTAPIIGPQPVKVVSSGRNCNARPSSHLRVVPLCKLTNGWSRGPSLTDL